MRGGIVALQVLGFSRHAVARDARRVRQLATAAGGKLLPLARVVEFVEHRRKILARFHLCLRAVLRDETVGEVHGLAVAVEDNGRVTIFLDGACGIGKFLRQRLALCAVQCAEAHIGRAACAEGKLTRDERRNAGIMVKHPLVDGRFLLAATPCEGDGILLLREEGELVERRRQTVEKTGQQLARGGKVCVHAAQAFDDASLRIEQYKVRPPPHALEHELLLADLTKLVRALERQDYHAFKIRLLDRKHARADQVLSQQHAEHRRLGGVVAQNIGKLNARLVCPRVEQQSQIAAQQQNNLVARGLLHLVDARADELRSQLV